MQSISESTDISFYLYCTPLQKLSMPLQCILQVHLYISKLINRFYKNTRYIRVIGVAAFLHAIAIKY